VRTRHLSLVTSTHSVTTTVRSNALSPFGPVRAGLTTWQTTNDPVLTELLSSLEREVANLLSKSVVSSIAIEGAGTDDKE
jgi:hypothetical protein